LNEFKQLDIWDVLASEAPQEDVQIEGVVNLKASPISHYKVSMAYGDLTLIIAMIRDYIRGLDQMYQDGDLRINSIEYEAYYRKKFMGIADKISEQIEYDYDAKLKKCLKKLEKQDNSDIGEEALALTIKRTRAKAEQEQKNGNDSTAVREDSGGDV
jgi:hypothetical protein